MTKPVLRRTVSSSPWSFNSSQKRAVRRSCQTMALATGWLVARSHSTTVSRWLVMPIAHSSLARILAARNASAITFTVISQTSSASCSTQPGLG
jgi:hypothetical protein